MANENQALDLAAPETNQNLANLVRQFSPVFTQAAQEAGQAGYADNANISNVMGGLVQGYANKYKEKTGKVPTSQEINSFVGSVVSDMPTAYQLITNQLPAAVVAEKYASPHIQSIIEKGSGDSTVNNYLKESVAGAEGQYAKENSLIDQLTTEAQRGTRVNAEQAYGDELRRVNAENASLGRMTQPVAQENANRSQQGFFKGLSNAIAGIQGQSLQSKAAANTSLSDRLQKAREFGVSAGLQSRGLGIQEKGINANQRNVEGQSIMDRITGRLNREAASDAGRLQAEANEPGTLDFINTGFQGLSALGGLATGVGAGMGLYQRLKPSTTGTATGTAKK